MSTCISEHGERSDHLLGTNHACVLCGTIDQEKRAAVFDQMSSEIRFLFDQLKNMERQRDEALAECNRLRERIHSAARMLTSIPPVSITMIQ